MYYYLRKLSIYLLLYLPQIGMSCPLCSTQTGVVVQAAIFNAYFLPTIAAIALPYIFLSSIAFCLYYSFYLNKKWGLLLMKILGVKKFEKE